MNMGPLVERADSPQISGTPANMKVTRIYTAAYGENWMQYIPEAQTLSEDGDGYFSDFSATPGPGYTVVSLNFTSKLDGGGVSTPKRVGQVSYSLSINMIENPLEDHTNYLCMWNYHLYGAGTIDPKDVPDLEGWSETDTTLVAHGDGVDWIWSKADPGAHPDPTKMWYLVQERTKPGKEAWRQPQPSVHEFIWTKTQEAAEACLLTAPYVTAPGETFGWTGGEWLGMPVGLSYNGDIWAGENVYDWAEAWDRDLYNGP